MLVICVGCGQALAIEQRFVAQGPVLPADADTLVVGVHDCPGTLLAAKIISGDE